MQDVWKEAFAVGTEWDQFDSVYKVPWDFSNLDEAFDEGGVLHGKKVFLFGCTEPQMVPFKGQLSVFHVPAVVAVVSPSPPSEKLGIKSVQMEQEQIVAMREMKMGWVPVLGEHDELVSLERAAKRQKVFALKCTQRRAGLRQLKTERLKKYEYCLPYVWLPDMQADDDDNTDVDIMYTFEDESLPPVVTDFDWSAQTVESFTEDMIENEELPATEKERFMGYLKDLVKKAKEKKKEAKQMRRKTLEDMTEEQRDALKNMKVYKFYPKPNADSPDIAEVKSNYVNRYYGKAHEVL